MYEVDYQKNELDKYIETYPKSYKLYKNIIEKNQSTISKIYMLRTLHEELLNMFSKTVKGFLPVNNMKLCLARAYLGYCKRNRNETCDISISEHLFTIGFIPIVNVMAHEMIHSIKDFPRGHKDAFISMMNKLNYIYGLHIQTKGAYRCNAAHLRVHIEEKKPKYCLKCISCGNKYYYYRKTKYVKNYMKCHCGKCKGRLKLEILNCYI